MTGTEREALAPSSTATAAVDLVWLPLGAGATGVVRWSGRAYEAVSAFLARRPRKALFHAALMVTIGDERGAVEMVPQWSSRVDGTAVAVTGPVGSALLGRSRWFRYEVRRSPGGWLPDARFATAQERLSVDPRVCGAVPEAMSRVPTLVWGRTPPGGPEMWNSNSVIAWLLAAAGLDPRDIGPPDGGRAPGWAAGIAVWAAGPIGAELTDHDHARAGPPGR